MRLLICLFFFSFFSSAGFAQVSKIDSLKNLLGKDPADSNRVTHLWRLAEQYQSFKPDTALLVAQEALLLAQRLKYVEGESRALAMLALAQNLLGNYSSALNNYLLKLKIEEKRNSPRNYASALGNIGMMHIQLGEYTKALSYLYQADSTIEAVGGKAKAELKYSFLINLGEAYYRKMQLDSAAVYFENSLLLAKAKNDRSLLGISMLALGNVNSLQDKRPAALQYYFQAINYLNDGLNNDFLCEASLGLAKLYTHLPMKDSATYYGRMSFGIAKKDGFLSREQEAANFLSQIFKKKKIFDSAYYYLEITTSLKDSLKGQDKIKEAMIIAGNEQLRQAEMAEQKLRDKNARHHQLQLLLIAIFIPIFFLLTLFISRTKIHKTVIEYMGIISVLLVFEYLTLLLHPFVSELTNHTPIVEIIIFVSLATVIIPLHHKLEHLLIANLTREKHHAAKKNPVK